MTEVVITSSRAKILSWSWTTFGLALVFWWLASATWREKFGESFDHYRHGDIDAKGVAVLWAIIAISLSVLCLWLLIGGRNKSTTILSANPNGIQFIPDSGPVRYFIWEEIGLIKLYRDQYDNINSLNIDVDHKIDMGRGLFRSWMISLRYEGFVVNIRLARENPVRIEHELLSLQKRAKKNQKG